MKDVLKVIAGSALAVLIMGGMGCLIAFWLFIG